jgi:hypothetical protein
METELKLEVGKLYITRAGSRARVIAIDAKSEQPVVALVIQPGGDYEFVEQYSLDGMYLIDETSDNDIICEWVPWVDVPVDTKIRVKNHIQDNWLPRHFAKWNPVDRVVMAWDLGATSHSARPERISAWRIAEIVK